MATTSSKACTGCGKMQNIKDEYYVSSSKLHAKEGRLSYCKKCVARQFLDLLEEYEKNNEEDFEIKALYHLCLNVDWYFNKKLALTALSKKKKNDKTSIMKSYISMSNSLRQYKVLTSKNSDVLEIEQNSKENEISPLDSFTVTMEMLQKWGINRPTQEYFYLENKYKEYAEKYGDSTPTQKTTWQQIAKCLLQGDKELEAGQTGGFAKMNDSVAKLMKNAGIEPSQELDNFDEKEFRIGMSILDIENTEPIGEVAEIFKDTDLIEHTIKEYYTKQMQRDFGFRNRDE